MGGAKRRASKASAKFFLRWVRERAERVKLDNADQRRAVMKYHTEAEKFWTELAEKADAD